MDKNSKTGRRRFLTGILAGAGVAAVAATAPRAVRAGKPQEDSSDQGPILYRRTKDVERYYKTLYS